MTLIYLRDCEKFPITSFLFILDFVFIGTQPKKRVRRWTFSTNKRGIERMKRMECWDIFKENEMKILNVCGVTYFVIYFCEIHIFCCYLLQKKWTLKNIYLIVSSGAFVSKEFIMFITLQIVTVTTQTKWIGSTNICLNTFVKAIFLRMNIIFDQGYL